jgi:Ribbon-helix-helix protein, copG family
MTTNRMAERLKAVGGTPPVHTPTDIESQSPRNVKSRKPIEQTWDAQHRRATFHLPNSLLDELDVYASRTGQAKSAVVRAAIEAAIRS